MTTETLEELRERLLRRHNVQQMIQARAYEIYRMRGGQPGGEAQDWFHAESEVLAFLLADESTQEDEPAEEAAAAVSASEAPTKPAPAKKPRARAAKPTDSKPPTKKKAASKRATPKKPVEPKTKSPRISRKSKPEESHK